MLRPPQSTAHLQGRWKGNVHLKLVTFTNFFTSQPENSQSILPSWFYLRSREIPEYVLLTCKASVASRDERQNNWEDAQRWMKKPSSDQCVGFDNVQEISTKTISFWMSTDWRLPRLSKRVPLIQSCVQTRPYVFMYITIIFSFAVNWNNFVFLFNCIEQTQQASGTLWRTKTAPPQPCFLCMSMSFLHSLSAPCQAHRGGYGKMWKFKPGEGSIVKCFLGMFKTLELTNKNYQAVLIHRNYQGNYHWSIFICLVWPNNIMYILCMYTYTFWIYLCTVSLLN